MADSFDARLKTLPDAELRRVVESHLLYRTEIVLAAAAELLRRGAPVATEEWQSVRARLARRDAEKAAGLSRGFVRRLGASLPARLARIRLLTACLLAAGLGSAGYLYATARPSAAHPFGYEPEESGKYLRQIEQIGGKANVLAGQFMRWFGSFWEGESLAITLACLTLLLTYAFWSICTREARALAAGEETQARRAGE